MIRIVTESMSDFTQEEAKAADLIVSRCRFASAWRNTGMTAYP